MRPLRMPAWTTCTWWRQTARMRCHRSPSWCERGLRWWRGVLQMLRQRFHHWLVHRGRRVATCMQPRPSKLGNGSHRRETHGGWSRRKPSTHLPHATCCRCCSCHAIHLSSLAPACCLRLTSQQVLPMRAVFLKEKDWKLENFRSLTETGSRNHIPILVVLFYFPIPCRIM